MKKKLSVSIGIPAYNEEANIKFLLESLLRQKLTAKIKLQEIIVISDGSTDKTVKFVRSIPDPRIKIVIHKERSGVYRSQNEIAKLACGDVLVLLDADILPQDENFIEAIIAPILYDRKIGIVGAETTSANPDSFFERIISYSHEFKKDIYKKINGGNNIYLCHGRARAFSKKLYSNILWPKNCPEDAYSYLYCIKNGFKFVFEPKAKVIYRSPSLILEYAEKNNRFTAGKKELEKYFDSKILKQQYRIPLTFALKSLGKFLLKQPTTIVSYIFIYLLARLFKKYFFQEYSMWKISHSSKRLVYGSLLTHERY